MKAYKIDLSGFTGKVREVASEAVQKKAFELGYEWIATGKNIMKYPGDLGIIFSAGGEMSRLLSTSENPAITADAFLALESAWPEFKPFDKVLVRDAEKKAWCADIYSHLSKDEPGIHICVGGAWPQVIPYEGNEHILGTTNKE